jgi:hypothetical protein
MAKSSRQKISVNLFELNNIINHLGLLDISGLLQSTTAENIFFSRSLRQTTFWALKHTLTDLKD